MIARETIYAALFATLSAVAGFVTTSRRLKHWDDVPQQQQPALFLSQHTETLTTSPGGDRHWQFSLIALIYVHTQADKTIAPTTLLNPIIDSVVAALLPDAITKRNTLGGVVMDAQISGAIEIDHYDDQAVVAIPITIKAAQ